MKQIFFFLLLLTGANAYGQTTIIDYKNKVDSSITNKIQVNSISPKTVGNRLTELADIVQVSTQSLIAVREFLISNSGSTFQNNDLIGAEPFSVLYINGTAISWYAAGVTFDDITGTFDFSAINGLHAGQILTIHYKKQ